MANHLTDEQLDAIDARAKAATEGPWTVGEGHRSDLVLGEFAEDRLAVAKQPANGLGATAWDEANAVFIAHARTDVPALVRDVRRGSEAYRVLMKASVRAMNGRDRAKEVLTLAVDAANEAFNTIEDDADSAATVACLLRDAVEAALAALGAPVRTKKVTTVAGVTVHDEACSAPRAPCNCKRGGGA